MTTIVKQPSSFDWQGTPLRTFRDQKGLIWFVAKDVCQALDLTNTARALDRLDEDMKGVTTVNTLGGPQLMTTVSEPGLYALVFRSRKAEARSFQRWVTNDVLPAIRAEGVYIRGEEKLLASATHEELQARIAELQAIAARGLVAKATKGLDALEEKDARRQALKILAMDRGQKSKKRWAKPIA